MLSWLVSVVCALVYFHLSGLEYFVVSLAFMTIYTQKFPAVNVAVFLVFKFLWTFYTWMCPADISLNSNLLFQENSKTFYCDLYF